MRKVPIEETGQKQAPGELALIQAFVNSNDIESQKDKFDNAEKLTAWLINYEFLNKQETVTIDDWNKALEFREALRKILLANNGENLDQISLETINKIARASTFQFQFQSNKEMEIIQVGSSVDHAIGDMMKIIFQAMGDGTWKRLKTCPYHTCYWVFYDLSKNLSGTWCSMEVCGSRVKSQNYRKRKKTR
ncbi:CGNR zinc finger domain-containing protein [Evansella halocellulosilytica]|uniref:CGNR zinc finger domain-containing protein n=1 Tax=Evansella halocellulosilytica TaxID=2011013 RepID=UPI0015CD2EC1|nr:CGNR zinc finger domain-containing protein [Evansella halocellulosilytica]